MDLIDELIGVVAPSILTALLLYAVLGAKTQLMLLTAPFVIYGIFRVLFLIHYDGSKLPDDPTELVLAGPSAPALHRPLGSERRRDHAGRRLMARALVTGGTGFTGSTSPPYLADAGWTVRTFDVNPPDTEEAQQAPVHSGRHARRRGHARGGARVRARGGERRAGARHPLDRRGVPLGERGRMPSRRSRRPRREGAHVVRISSSAIYGKPTVLPTPPEGPIKPFDPYGRSKAEAERRWPSGGTRGSPSPGIRPRTLVGGGRLGLFDVIFARVRGGKRVPVFGRGANRSQLCDVEDLCSGRAGRGRAAGQRGLQRGQLRLRDRAAGHRGADRARRHLVAHPAGAGVGDQGGAPAARPGGEVAVHGVALGIGRIGLLPRHLEDHRGPGWHAEVHEPRPLSNSYDDYIRAKNRDADGPSAHRSPLRGGLARLLRG